MTCLSTSLTNTCKALVGAKFAPARSANAVALVVPKVPALVS